MAEFGRYFLEARKHKRDEFFTQISDIEDELSHYTKHFNGKTVYCNCDNPYTSNFAKYFIENFNSLRLKRLIVTGYKGNTDLFKESERGLYLDYNGMQNGDAIDLITNLKGNGDFRSQECIEFLDQSDIVVTNPPFSLFRQYVEMLIKHGKKFIIVGNQNAVTYKSIFRLIKENKLWMGYGFKGGHGSFINKYYTDYTTGSSKIKDIIRVSGVRWYTNIDIQRRHENFILYEQYYGNENKYPRYDNFDAIEVSRIKDIPMDYEGVMGVPITFIAKHNPQQFEILGKSHNREFCEKFMIDQTSKNTAPILNGKKLYHRIFISNKQL